MNIIHIKDSDYVLGNFARSKEVCNDGMAWLLLQIKVTLCCAWPSSIWTK
jgi:hypothetical protein